MKKRFYAWISGFYLQPKDRLEVSWVELVTYYGRRGAGSLLRGFFWRWRFRACGRQLHVGKDATILFAGRISLGNRVLFGDRIFLNGLSQNGMRFGNQVHIREDASIQATAVLHHPGIGLEIGDGTYIGPRCMIGAGGGVRIGRHVAIGSEVHLLAENHAFNDPSRPIHEQGVTRRGIVIEDDCWIGNKCVILDGVTIGAGSVVGAAAVVTESIPPRSIAVGHPARVIRTR